MVQMRNKRMVSILVAMRYRIGDRRWCLCIHGLEHRSGHDSRCGSWCRFGIHGDQSSLHAGRDDAGQYRFVDVHDQPGRSEYGLREGHHRSGSEHRWPYELHVHD